MTSPPHKSLVELLDETTFPRMPPRKRDGRTATDKHKSLVELLDEMRSTGVHFNAVIYPEGYPNDKGESDVARLCLLGNADDLSVCCEDGTYDIWSDKDGLIVHSLSKTDAARRMVEAYQKAKEEK